MWTIDSALTTTFDFDYEAGRDQLLRLYDKGTRKQWLASDRKAFDDMGVIGFADADIDAEMAHDEQAADAFDDTRLGHVRQVATEAADLQAG